MRRSLSLAVAVLSTAAAGLAAPGLPATALPVTARPAASPASVSTPVTEGERTAREAQFDRVNAYATRVGALGVYYDDAASRYVVRMPRPATTRSSPAAPAAPMASSVRIADGTDAGLRTGRSTATELAALRSTLADRAWAPGAKGHGYGFHYDAQADVLAVTTDAPAAVMRPLQARYSTLLRITYGDVGRQSRQSDPAPHRGGASITNGTDICTSGFTITSTARYLVTAGHCFDVGQPVLSTGGGQAWGTVRNRPSFPRYDFAAIGGSTYGSVIYRGDATGTTILVSGAADPAVGAKYCRSGQTTQEKCSLTVTSLTGQFCDDSGCTPDLVTYRGSAGEGGDSGAPLFQYVRGTVQIRGLHIAHGGDTMYAHRWSTIQSVFRAQIAVR